MNIEAGQTWESQHGEISFIVGYRRDGSLVIDCDNGKMTVFHPQDAKERMLHKLIRNADGSPIEPEGEQCQCCGEYGPDRRTLWMACFYAMDEFQIPFKKEFLFRVDPEDAEPGKDPVKLDLPNGPQINISPGTIQYNGELSPRGFFTLRVCKVCRGRWLRAIEQWFQAKGADVT